MTRTLECILLACCISTSACASSPTGATPSSDSSVDSSDSVVDSAGCARDLHDVAVASTDPYAYPPYALDGCTLVYVSSDGALHVRDLGTAVDALLEPAASSPRRPTVAGETIAWEVSLSGVSAVRVRSSSTTIATLSGPAGAPAGEPRAARDAVVFTQWRTSSLSGDTDVVLYVPSTATTTTIAGGAGQQRFSDISDAYVAVSDFSEDPDGRFDNDGNDLADIALYDRANKTLSSRKKAGKQAFPILVGGLDLAYLDWASVHPEPKFEAYEIWKATIDTSSPTPPTTGDTRIASVQTASPYVQPAGRGGVLEWVVRDTSGVALWRSYVTKTDAPAPVTSVTGVDLFAPALSSNRTAIGVRATASGPVGLQLLGR